MEITNQIKIVEREITLLEEKNNVNDALEDAIKTLQTLIERSEHNLDSEDWVKGKKLLDKYGKYNGSTIKKRNRRPPFVMDSTESGLVVGRVGFRESE
jgi:hypothetical protein